DGLGKGIAALRARAAGTAWAGLLATGLVNVALGLMLATGWPVSGWAVLGTVVGIRMLTNGWLMLLGRPTQPDAAEPPPEAHPDARLRLPPHPAFATLNASLKAKDDARRAIDAYWCWIFVLVFFAIHMGRMRVYWDLVGMIDPLVAVAGDVAMALGLALCIVLPVRLAWQKLTRPLERRGWRHPVARIDRGGSPGPVGRLSGGWLTGRLRFARRLGQIRRSPREALAWGLRTGLPITAILVAINPLWGDNNYFFNTETWATAVWHRWSETRTD